MEATLILSISIVFYTYIGYGLLLFVLMKIRKKNSPIRADENHQEKVSFIVAAYNEATIIEEKILNTLALDYPSDKLELIFVTDGSTDGTNDLIRKYTQVKLEFRPERRGKIHAVNRIMRTVKNPITVFSDANVLLNKEALTNLVKHFSHKNIGAVSGEKKVWSDIADNASASGEGLYWKYESFLKKMDAQFNTLVGAAGELFAIRTKLYEHIPNDTIIEDFALTVGIAAKGYQVMYEPEAVAFETASESIGEEEKRKIRISSGGIQAILHFKRLFNLTKYGKLAFQFISHRVLRWTVAPLLLPVIFILNLALFNSGNGLFDLLMICQIGFYSMAFAGYMLREQKTKIKILHIPFYFVFMNVCVYKGWIRFFSNTQSVVWEKAERVILTEDIATNPSRLQ